MFEPSQWPQCEKRKLEDIREEFNNLKDVGFEILHSKLKRFRNALFQYTEWKCIIDYYPEIQHSYYVEGFSSGSNHEDE